MELLKKMNVQFRVSGLAEDNALDSVPIFIACIGAEIHDYQLDSYEEYLDIGKTFIS